MFATASIAGSRRRSGVGAAAQFGQDLGTASNGAVFSGEHDVCRHTNDSGYNVRVSTVRLIGINSFGGGTPQASVALYADDGSNLPGTLLQTSNTVTMALGDVDFTLAATVDVAAAATVWVAIKCQNALTLDHGLLSPTNNLYRFKASSYATAFSDPFGASSAYTAWLYFLLIGVTY
jgi:hypothetical protein